MTLLRSMTTGAMGPSMAVEGATTSRVFETYVERLLPPSSLEKSWLWTEPRSAPAQEEGEGADRG
jgi:hypothetical protein